MTNRNQLEECPLCEGGRLEPRSDHVFRFRYLKREHQVEGLEHAVCDSCGSSLFIQGQSTRNKERVDAYQRSIVGEIGPQDIISLREKYGMTQAQATKIFHCAPRAFSKWERGEVAPSGATALLLRVALDNPSVMRALAEKAGEKVHMPHAFALNEISAMVWLRDSIFEVDHRIKEAYDAGRRAGLVQKVNVVFHSHEGSKIFAQADAEFDAVPESLLWPRSEKNKVRILN